MILGSRFSVSGLEVSKGTVGLFVAGLSWSPGCTWCSRARRLAGVVFCPDHLGQILFYVQVLFVRVLILCFMRRFLYCSDSALGGIQLMRDLSKLRVSVLFSVLPSNF